MIDELLRLLRISPEETQRDYALVPIPMPCDVTLAGYCDTHENYHPREDYKLERDNMTGDEAVQQLELEWGNEAVKGECRVCRTTIKTMAFLGTGACCTLHQKVLDHELTLGDLKRIESGQTREDGIK